ncbi:MAG: antibiotic biosynthesis monooxygenase [Nocardioidaceae bacterium]
MLVVTRYRIPLGEADSFAAGAEAALGALAGRNGFVEGVLGRNVDEPVLWTLTTRWRDVGSYRRALSAHDVRLTAVPLLSRAVDEPTAYQVVLAR